MARSLSFLSSLMLCVVAWLGATACRRADEAPQRSLETPRRAVARDVEIRGALASLRSAEREQLARTDFSRVPPSSRSLGANPYALAVLPGGEASPESILSNPARLVGLLRGDSRIVLLDAGLEPTRSLPAPASPTDLAVLPDGRVFVVGPLERRIASYRVRSASIEAGASLELPEARALRAVAAAPGVVVAADFATDRLFFTTPDAVGGGVAALAQPSCRGPFRLALSAHFLGVACLFDHAVAILRRDDAARTARELVRIVHDGPIWSFSLVETEAALFIGVGGVEDHPLERRDKAFGYIDSFVFLYRFDPAHGIARLGELNVSELGVVTPKSIDLRLESDGLSLTAFGYASDRSATVRFDVRAGRPPVAVTHAALPGCAETVLLEGRAICANPLFDGWVDLSEPPRVHPVRRPEPRDPNPQERLGEALFFTTLMAPDAVSDGRRSRFSCETCHFEGGTDGRVHHSGRDEIRVSTRPLFGLANAAPFFSRAHDPDLTAVCHNEFSVANRGNPVAPWFAISARRFPWLAELGIRSESVAPLELRGALSAFLSRFSHEENPMALARASPRRFTASERRGAELFYERCASCHAARLVSGVAASEVPFDRWEERVLAIEGALVWSGGEYARTGVEPYVDRRGTRVPSLRRLSLKRPYLTNGAAPDLGVLLEMMRFTARGTLHAIAEDEADARRLSVGERASLLAFLQLL